MERVELAILAFALGLYLVVRWAVLQVLRVWREPERPRPYEGTHGQE